MLGAAVATARRAPARRRARGRLAPFQSSPRSLELLIRGTRTIAGASARVVRKRSGAAPQPAPRPGAHLAEAPAIELRRASGLDGRVPARALEDSRR